MYSLTLNKEKRITYFKKKLSFVAIKRKSKNSLWRQISKKRRKNLKKTEANKNLFFYTPDSLVESKLRDKLTSFIPKHVIGDTIQKLYQQYIQNNKFNSTAYRQFYNKLSAKIDTLKIIDMDQGRNIALTPSIFAKLLSLLTYSVEFTSSVILMGLGASARHGVNEISDIRKIKKAKNKLDHCITEINFIKLLSILLTKMHELDLVHQEKLDIFINKQFLNFWTLFKKQATLYPDIENLDKFWSTCLLLYFKGLKCSLLKENFNQFLNDVTEIKEQETNLTRNKPEIVGVNYFSQPKETIGMYSASLTTFLAQPFALQIPGMQLYLAQLHMLKQLLVTAPVNPRLVETTGFWQTPSASFQPIPVDIYPEFSPGLISCY